MKKKTVLILALSLVVGLTFYAAKGETQMCPGMRGRGMMMGSIVPPGTISENLPDPNGKGAELLVYYCTQCHNLPGPSMHTAEEWPAITDRMFRRMSMMSGMRGMGMMMSVEVPSPEEQRIIVAYLESHGMKSISPHTLPSPESKGAVSFKEFCSQCHALPDPKLHTPKEWPAVVEKMRGFMQAMDKKVVTGTEEKEIVGYLESHAQK